MKTQQSNQNVRRRHTQSYKAEALKLAERISVAAAAKQLSLATSQLYSWRSKARNSESQSDVEQHQAEEIVTLKGQLAILRKAAAYFAKSLK